MRRGRVISPLVIEGSTAPPYPCRPLGAGVDLLEASTNDAYALPTRFPTSLTLDAFPSLEYLDRRNLLGIAEALAVKALDEDDLDLLSEVLMAPPILRTRVDTDAVFCVGCAGESLGRIRFVPGPGVPPAPENETHSQKVRRVLGTLYHTMFASGLCCATVIACSSLPAEVEHTRGGLEAPPGKGSAWKINWKQSSRPMQESLSLLSLGFSLRRAIDDVESPARPRSLAVSCRK